MSIINKILFEQLWNAHKICDEQTLYIKYINMIDIETECKFHLF